MRITDPGTAQSVRGGELARAGRGRPGGEAGEAAADAPGGAACRWLIAGAGRVDVPAGPPLQAAASCANAHRAATAARCLAGSPVLMPHTCPGRHHPPAVGPARLRNAKVTNQRCPGHECHLPAETSAHGHEVGPGAPHGLQQKGATGIGVSELVLSAPSAKMGL